MTSKVFLPVFELHPHMHPYYFACGREHGIIKGLCLTFSDKFICFIKVLSVFISICFSSSPLQSKIIQSTHSPMATTFHSL